MKAKTVLILAVVALLAAGAYVLLGSSPHSERQVPMGSLLMDDLAVNAITGIRIASNAGDVELRKKSGLWTVVNRADYPAAFEKIVDFVRKLQATKVGRSFATDPNLLDRLALHAPGAGTAPEHIGTRVVLTDAGGQPLADIILGSTRESSAGFGGQYVKFTEAAQIHLVDKTFKFVDTTPDGWIREEVVNIDKQSIESVSAYTGPQGDRAYLLKRPSADAAFELTEPPNEAPLISHKTDRLCEALSPLRVSDVRPAAAESRPSPGLSRLEYRLYDGRVYRVYIEPGPEDPEEQGHRIYLRVAYPDDRPETSGKDGGAAPSTGAADPIQLDQWIFLLNDWEFESFVTDPGALTQKTDTKPAS
jgi:hypothetical protein